MFASGLLVSLATSEAASALSAGGTGDGVIKWIGRCIYADHHAPGVDPSCGATLLLLAVACMSVACTIGGISGGAVGVGRAEGKRCCVEIIIARVCNDRSARASCLSKCGIEGASRSCRNLRCDLRFAQRSHP